MTDPASIISAVCSGVAVIITAAGGAWLAYRQGKSIRVAEDAKAELAAVKADQARGFQENGRRQLELKDDLNTVKGVQQAHGQTLAAVAVAGYSRSPQMDQTPTQPMTPGYTGSVPPPPAVPPVKGGG